MIRCLPYDSLWAATQQVSVRFPNVLWRVKRRELTPESRKAERLSCGRRNLKAIPERPLNSVNAPDD